MKKFRERNPVPIGVGGAVVMAVVVLLAYNTSSLTAAVGGTEYSAMFAEAGGLEAGDDVRVAGLPVGTVESVELAGPGVAVTFTVDDDDVHLRAGTTAAVSVATILGDKFLNLASRGDGVLPAGAQIPLERTDSPYDLTDALGELTTETRELDVERLSAALDTVADTLQGTPPELRAALEGVSALSETISSRDEALRQLLGSAEGVSGVLADRSRQLQLLVADGNLVLAELQRRRVAIDQLFVHVSALSAQLRGLVADNEEQLEPALQRLNSVLEVLERNEHNIEAAISGAAAYVGSLGEALASGPFFNAYVQNLVAGNVVPLPDALPQLAAPEAPAAPQGGTR